MEHIDYIAAIIIEDNKGKPLAQTNGTKHIKRDSLMVTQSLFAPF